MDFATDRIPPDEGEPVEVQRDTDADAGADDDEFPEDDPEAVTEDAP